MKIAVNAVRVSSRGGGGIDHYIIHLCNEMARLGANFDIYTLSPSHFTEVNPERIIKPFSFRKVTAGKPGGTVAVSSSGGKGNVLRSLLANFLGDWVKMFWIQFVFPFHLAFKKYDVLFSPSQIDALPFSWFGARQVVAVLDLIPFILKDQKHKHMFFLEKVLPVVVKNSARIITISENTKKDVVKFFGVPESKVTATLLAKPEFGAEPSAENVEEIRLKYNMGKYILCVSGNHPHKNIAGLIKAYDFIKDKTALKLVVCGFQEKDMQIVLEKLVAEKKLQDRVLFLGHAPAGDLPSIYSGAEVFVFPSMYEGFGLPVLEALHYGLPVVVSNSSSLPEVAGDAALYFSPSDTAEMSHKILELVSNEKLKSELRQKAKLQAAKFSWKKTAEQTLRVLETAVG